jgi:predicted SAM-dependent methyltransferase
MIRNRSFQLRSERVRTLKFIDIGCGRNPHPDLINCDYAWTPAIDLCWDITRGLPFGAGSMHGICSEHCLEHFPLPVAAAILKDCRRILAPGGRIRIVVPDAEIYIHGYMQARAGQTVTFPYQDIYKFESISDPILHVNRIFYQDRHSLFGHRFMYDATMLEKLLKHAGFVAIERQSFQKGKIRILLIDSPDREVESLYMEAEVG